MAHHLRQQSPKSGLYWESCARCIEWEDFMCMQRLYTQKWVLL